MSDKKLLPCPCCGWLTSVRVSTPADIEGDEDGSTTDFAVVCDRTQGGCGTSGGYRPKKKEARALWNTRHYAAFGNAIDAACADHKPAVP